SSRSLRVKQGRGVVENTGGVGEVAMINYAAAIDADIVLAGAVERNELQSLPRDLQTWARDHSSPALQATRKKITSRIKGVDFTTYAFATFFTAGLPVRSDPAKRDSIHARPEWSLLRGVPCQRDHRRTCFRRQERSTL